MWRKKLWKFDYIFALSIWRIFLGKSFRDLWDFFLTFSCFDMISDAFGQTFRRNAQIRQQRKCAWSGLWCLHEWSHFRSNGPFDGRSYLFVSTNLCILMQHLTSFPEGRCQPERVTLRRGLMITGNAFEYFKCKTAL